MTWRDDDPVRNDKEVATVTCVVTTAEDRIESLGVHTLYIRHVRTVRGKGFRCNVRSEHDTCSGDVRLGTEEADYEAVKTEGIEMLKRLHAELKQSTAAVAAAARLREQQ